MRLPRRPVRGFLQLALAGLPVAALVVLGWHRRWMSDDGFIYLRVVDQIRAGNGPVFNAGERVEAFTSPLWAAILTVADLTVPLRLEWLAVLLGIGLSAAGVVMAMAGARLLQRGDAPDAFLVPFGVLVIGALFPVWVFQTAGLENGLVFAWLGACLWILAHWARRAPRSMPLPQAVVLGLGWLVRPELVLFSAAFFVLVLAVQAREQSWRGRLGTAGAMLMIPVAYQVFRMGYYGALTANTAIAKEGTVLRWDRGWLYLRDFVDPYWLWLPLAALVLGGYVPLLFALRRARATPALLVVLAFLGAGLLSGLYVIWVGGDFMHARLYLPSLFALCAPVAVVAATRRYLAALAIVPWAIVAAVALRPAQVDAGGFPVNGIVLHPTQGRVTLEDFGWHEEGPSRSWYDGPAYYYSYWTGFTRHFAQPEIPLRPEVDVPLVAMTVIGIAGYALGPDVYVIDTLGLADPFTARLVLTPDRGDTSFPLGRAGHEKQLPRRWLAARITRDDTKQNPDAYPVPSIPLVPLADEEEFEEQVAWASAALQCPPIERLELATEAPLTPRRFAANFVRSFRTTSMRIPPDPREAYREFCGDGIPPEVRALALEDDDSPR